MDRDNTQAALELASLGYRVVPIHTVDGEKCDCPNGARCPSPAKHPRITDWPKNASADAVHVERWFKAWPHANVGIATGAASNLVVIDIDPRNGGYEELLRLYAEHGNPPAGPVAYTGGGGWHLYFKHPGGKVLSRSIAPGIDCKGDGGQVVAPPSFHASGNQYEWCETGLEYEKPELPDWLLLMVKSDQDEGPSSYAKPVVGAIAEGKRRETLLSLAGTMRRRGFGQEGIFRALMAENDERCAPPLERTEVASIAASAARDWEPQEGIVVSSGKSPEGVLGKHGQKRSVEPRTITLREIQGKTYPPPKWAVPGYMPVGLTLLAGRAKQGKSWMMMGIAIAIAEGGIAFGTTPVEDGEVLYLAYEDYEARWQGRARTLLGETVTWPERLHVAPTGCWPQRDDGGLEAIDSFLGVHPNCRLVVMDTLQRFRGADAMEGDKNAYAADYKVSGDLQELALKHDVAIAVVHHFRKALSEVDWIDQISGSNGIGAAADVIWGFFRERGDNQSAILKTTGRDVFEESLALSWDTAQLGWYVSGTAEEVTLSAEAKEFTEAMLEVGHGSNVHYKKVAELMGKKQNTTLKMARRLAERAQIIAVGDGFYRPLSLDVTVSPQAGARYETGVSPEVSPVVIELEPVTTGDKAVTPPVTPILDSSDTVTSKVRYMTPGFSAGAANGAAPWQPCARCGEANWLVRAAGGYVCGTCKPWEQKVE